jgi:prefoldin subunit 2
LQQQYSNYKNALQTLAQKVGEIEQEIEEHKYVSILFGGNWRLVGPLMK